MKLPALLLYTGDWLKDPALSFCSPSTRGIWVDLLCAMHEQGRSGKLTGTKEQLSRVARCSTAEIAAALFELHLHKAADVTERNGVFTVINRRMQRECKSREYNTLRQQRFRRSAENNTSVTPIESDNGLVPSDPGKGGLGGKGPKHRPANVEEVITKGQMVGVSESDCRDWYADCEACGWLRGDGTPFDHWPRQLCIHRDKLRIGVPGPDRRSGPTTRKKTQAEIVADSQC